MKKKKIKKIKRVIKRISKGCPLAVILVVSTVVFSAAGLVYSVINGEKPETTMERPMFASVLAPRSHDIDAEGDNEYVADAEETTVTGEVTDIAGQITAPEGQTEVTTDAQGNPQIIDTSPKSDPANGVYLKVKKDYFDDALFIGDSRVEGLKIYSGLDNATFYCKEGISLTKILDEKIVKMKIKNKKKTVSIKRALKEKKFSKIYLMIGINEIGYRDTKEFKSKYKEVVDKIKELQPEAKIIILGMMKVTNEYAKKNPSFSIKNIEKKNKAIAELADNVNVFYLDFNSEICDSKGGVKKKYTWDGVHLKAEYYSIWVDFMKKHGI